MQVDFRISWRVNKLIEKLHAKHPHTERSGIARVAKREGHYVLTDIKFPEQENSSGNTEMSKEGIDKLIENVIETDIDSMEEWRCRIHSHHTMGCFWSGTDAAAKAWFNDGNTRFWFSVVTAYKGSVIDYKCALNIFKPINLELDIPVSVEDYSEEDLIADVGEETYNTIHAQVDALSVRSDPTRLDTHIQAVLEILNSDDNEENRVAVEELITEQEDAIIDSMRTSLLSKLTGSYFDEKVEELDKNIKKYVYNKKDFGTQYMTKKERKAYNKKYGKPTYSSWGFFKWERDEADDDDDLDEEDYSSLIGAPMAEPSSSRGDEDSDWKKLEYDPTVKQWKRWSPRKGCRVWEPKRFF